MVVGLGNEQNHGDALHAAEGVLDGAHVEDQPGADPRVFHAQANILEFAANAVNMRTPGIEGKRHPIVAHQLGRGLVQQVKG